jgi:photosynthetic reaction center cytochrome c subunit
MNASRSPKRFAVALTTLAAAALLSACEHPPAQTVQIGYRGVQMGSVYNPRTVELVKAANTVPAALPAAVTGEGIPLAKDTYQNIQVLKDLNIAEFTRVMQAMTDWVAPKQGCAYCHNTANLADDSMYQKVVARRMIEMTRHLNIDYKQHVAATGVTCYTCHRGQNIPANTWFINAGMQVKGAAAEPNGQNAPAASVGSTALPYDPFLPFLRDAKPIRVQSATALPTGTKSSIQHTEQTYGLMVHMSKALGVNCTFCHNSRAFEDWSSSTPQRVTAWHGVRMVRELNTAYLEPLTSKFPAKRLGPTGDVAKVYCTTCHQGVNKPLYGVSMAKDYPELTQIHAAVEAPPAPPPPAAAPVKRASR